MRRGDASRVAELHRHGISEGFLGRLGPVFCAQLYIAINDAPTSGVWVAESAAGEVVGFVSGSLNIGRCYAHALRRRGPQLAAAAFPALVQPRNWRNLWETVTYPARSRNRDGNQVAAPVQTRSELLSIAVDASVRGEGAASRLVDELERCLAAWGLDGPYRVATSASDARANRFYIKMGFDLALQFTLHGRPMHMYVKTPSAPHAEG